MPTKGTVIRYVASGNKDLIQPAIIFNLMGQIHKRTRRTGVTKQHVAYSLQIASASFEKELENNTASIEKSKVDYRIKNVGDLFDVTVNMPQG